MNKKTVILKSERDQIIPMMNEIYRAFKALNIGRFTISDFDRIHLKERFIQSKLIDSHKLNPTSAQVAEFYKLVDNFQQFHYLFDRMGYKTSMFKMDEQGRIDFDGETTALFEDCDKTGRKLMTDTLPEGFAIDKMEL